MVRADEDVLTKAVVTLASEYGRYGYRRITALLQSGGWQVGKDRHRNMAKALQRETAALIAWRPPTSTGGSRSDPATRTGRSDAVISHSAWFKNSVRSGCREE
jgi:hypothetical protein